MRGRQPFDGCSCVRPGNPRSRRCRHVDALLNQTNPEFGNVGAAEDGEALQRQRCDRVGGNIAAELQPFVGDKVSRDAYLRTGSREHVTKRPGGVALGDDEVSVDAMNHVPGSNELTTAVHTEGTMVPVGQ